MGNISTRLNQRKLHIEHTFSNYTDHSIFIKLTDKLGKIEIRIEPKCEKVVEFDVFYDKQIILRPLSKYSYYKEWNGVLKKRKRNVVITCKDAFPFDEFDVKIS